MADAARAWYFGQTALAEIENLPDPAGAPRTIPFPAEMAAIFQSQRHRSFPGGHSKEQGVTIVANANIELYHAIGMLGKDYALPATNDDTGMHLVLAQNQKRRGKTNLAAELKRRISVERLQPCATPFSQ